MSKAMTQGHKGDLFIFDLSFFGWMLLSGLTCGILGIVYVNPYMYTAHAGLYDALKDNALRQGFLRWEAFGQLPPPDVYKRQVWARAVSLTRVINSLLMGGSTFLTTWGSTMRKKVWVRDRPSTLAASRCPKGTLSMPPR